MEFVNGIRQLGSVHGIRSWDPLMGFVHGIRSWDSFMGFVHGCRVGSHGVRLGSIPRGRASGQHTLVDVELACHIRKVGPHKGQVGGHRWTGGVP